ncbi:hypothetical protein AURDEDRAFT_164028 [Auricularia subglabra TFB-10046 SS5]|nr:hypothetical protein AURDEDRAFT_164028 [Auricularia subglabra TFB-10046 SS5]
MPTYPEEATWFHTDSGHPGVAEYAAVILIHGMGWHGASFHRMFPFAAAAGLRLVALNRRGYPGTSPYTAAELDMMSSDHAEFRRTQGLGLARAIIHIADELDLPEGRLGVLAWSAGTWFLLAMLSAIDDARMSTRERARLGQLVGRAILVEPPCELVGDVPSVDAYTALRSNPELERSQHLATGYFEHQGTALASRAVHDLNFDTMLPSPGPLLDRLTAEEIAEMTCDGRAVDGPLFAPAWLPTHRNGVVAHAQERRGCHTPETSFMAMLEGPPHRARG